jgi:hypothetical protein
LADEKRKGRASKPSVASHPLFPVVVVLWFGALFGLASLAIHPTLIERLVALSGIDSVIPMAAPPLGRTTRILIALSMTGLGCAVGALVARRLAKPLSQKTSGVRRTSVATATITPDEAPSPVALFGAERDQTVDEDQPQRRRRQLAILDSDDLPTEDAPLPGNGQILSVAELPLKSFDEVDEIWLHSSERDRARTPAEREPGDRQAADDEAQTITQAPADTPADTLADTSADGDEDVTDPRNNRLFESYVRRVTAGVGSNDADAIPSAGFVTLAATEQSGAPDETIVAQQFDRPASAPVAAIGGDTTYANTAQRIASAPLDTLSHVELLERLAQTIARRQTDRALSRDHAEPSAAAQHDAPIPAALRPHQAPDHADDADDYAVPASIPLRTVAFPAAPGSMDDATSDESVLATGYSSLLGMSKGATVHDFARNDAGEAAAAPRAFDPPTAEAGTDQTEQALRAALATLRRMSGAA